MYVYIINTTVCKIYSKALNLGDYLGSKENKKDKYY